MCPNTFQLNPKHIRYGATTTSYSPEESFVDRRRYTWEAIVESFRAYRDKFGDVEVPNNFVIPVNEEWPQNIQGLKFGREIHLIRSMSKYVRGNTQRRRFLQSFGFDFNAEKTIKTKDLSKFEIFIEALLFYKQIHGDVDIDEDFIVPHQEPWPETCWGMCLSTELQAIVDEESNCLEFPIRR